jgi:hypothetical protein
MTPGILCSRITPLNSPRDMGSGHHHTEPFRRCNRTQTARTRAATPQPLPSPTPPHHERTREPRSHTPGNRIVRRRSGTTNQPHAPHTTRTSERD